MKSKPTPGPRALPWFIAIASAAFVLRLIYLMQARAHDLLDLGPGNREMDHGGVHLYGLRNGRLVDAENCMGTGRLHRKLALTFASTADDC